MFSKSNSMNDNFKSRKCVRLRHFDYNSLGIYFVTICVKDRMPILSNLESLSVGVGALDDPKIVLTDIGKTIEKYLLSSENIKGVVVDKYVIMPEHIHVIIFLNPFEYKNCQLGSSRAPTPTNAMLPHVISTFKRFCSKEIGFNIFQRGYMDHVIRNKEDYEKHVKYIYENPLRRFYNKDEID